MIFKDVVNLKICSSLLQLLIGTGTTFDNDFYVVVVGKQCRTQVTNTISLYKLTNALLLLICFS